MAGTRYGKINHDRIVNNIIRFPSATARDAFKAEFEAYHAEHDHDGEVPTFEFITAKDVKNPIDGGRVHNLEELTIDGYTWYEIKEYHTRKHPGSYTHYNMPSCCVSLLIVLGDNKDFIEAFRALEKSEQKGAATVEELKELLGLLKRQSYPIAFHLRKLHGSDDGWGYYDATRKPTPEVDNPYTDTFIYDDKKITQSLIPSFLGQLSDDSETHVRENALEKLQMIGEELVRRGYTVDSMLLNIDKKSESGEAEGDTPEAAEPEPVRKPDPEGCKQELRRVLRLQGELNKGNIDHKDLCATYHVSKDRVNQFADEVRTKAWENAVSQHDRYRDEITNVWLADKAVSESVDLHVFRGRIIEKFGLRENVFEKNFHGLTLRQVWQEKNTLQNIRWDLTLTNSSLLKQILKGDTPQKSRSRSARPKGSDFSEDAPETENRSFIVQGLSVFFSTEVDGQPDPNFGAELIYFGDEGSGEYDEELDKVPDAVVKAMETFLREYFNKE